MSTEGKPRLRQQRPASGDDDALPSIGKPVFTSACKPPAPMTFGSVQPGGKRQETLTRTLSPARHSSNSTREHRVLFQQAMSLVVAVRTHARPLITSTSTLRILSNHTWPQVVHHARSARLPQGCRQQSQRSIHSAPHATPRHSCRAGANTSRSASVTHPFARPSRFYKPSGNYDSAARRRS
jgi:hypothetical protein